MGQRLCWSVHVFLQPSTVDRHPFGSFWLQLAGLEKTIQARDVKPALETLLEARRVKAAPTMPSFSWEHLPMKLPEPRCQENLSDVGVSTETDP